jgi:hypothetical protein
MATNVLTGKVDNVVKKAAQHGIYKVSQVSIAEVKHVYDQRLILRSAAFRTTMAV